MLGNRFTELKVKIQEWTDASCEDALIAKLGPDTAPARVFWDTAAHGQESAPPHALAEFIASYADDWPWPHVKVTAAIADAAGLDESGYGFVSSASERACWPPLWGYRKDNGRYWSWVDNNSLWGNTALSHVPPFNLALREAMEELQPTFILSSHETVDNESKRGLFWPGCGLLVIEMYPLSIQKLRALVGMPGPGESPLGFLGYLGRRWLWLLAGTPRWKRNARLLADNEHYKLISKVIADYQVMHGEIAGEQWMRYQEAIGQITVGPGRIFHNPTRDYADWMTVTDYGARNHGAPGVTTETFATGELGLVGFDNRVKKTLTFAVALLDTLEEKALWEESKTK